MFRSVAGSTYRGADKSLARPGRKQARKPRQGRARFQQHRDASCYQVFFSPQGKAPKEIHAIQTETLACFLPGRAEDLSAPLYVFLTLFTIQRVHIRSVLKYWRVEPGYDIMKGDILCHYNQTV